MKRILARLFDPDPIFKASKFDVYFSQFFLILTWIFFVPKNIGGFNLEKYWEPISFFQWLPVESGSQSFPATLLLFGSIFGLLSIIGLLRKYSFFTFAIVTLISAGYPLNFGSLSSAPHLFAMFVLAFAFLELVDSESTSTSVTQLKSKKVTLIGVYQSMIEDLNPAYKLASLRAIVVTYYFCAGLIKIVNVGFVWSWSENLFRLAYQDYWQGPLLEWAINQPSGLITFICGLGLLIEFLAPLALLSKRFYFFFACGWISLHIGIILLSGDHYQFLLNIAPILATIPIFTLTKSVWVKLKLV